jgi:photosystem II stability/assembly factor-like uncharacterized protein
MSPIVPNGWIPLGSSCVINGQVGVDTIFTHTAPVSGRATAIALHPDDPDHKIFVGAASGGVWGSTDGGVTWAPLTDDQPSLAIGAMAFSTAAPRKLYVGCGEGNEGGEVLFGSGVLVYDEAPNHTGWRVLSHSLLEKMFVSAIAVETLPAGDHIVVGGALAGGTSIGLAESLDGGATWVPVTIGPTVSDPVTSIVLDTRSDPTQTRLYVAVRGDGIYLRIGPAGSGFTRLASTGAGALPAAGNGITRITLAMCPDPDPEKRKTLYAVYANNNGQLTGIYHTFDGGQTWQPVANMPDGAKQTNYNVALAVHPTIPSTVIFGETKLWRSITAGNVWEVISQPNGDSPGIHSDQHGVVFNPTNPSKVWAINDGGVWFSTDGGTSWQHRNRGLATMQHYSLAQDPDYPSLMLTGTQDNGIQRFEGHPSWNKVRGGDGFFSAIQSITPPPGEPRYWYGSFVFFYDGKVNAIFRSDKAGAQDSWTRITDGINSADMGSPPPQVEVPFVVDPSVKDVLYLGTTKLYRTENRGDQWTPIRRADGTVFSTGSSLDAKITAIAVSPSDSNTLYAGTADGRIFYLQRNADGKYTITDQTHAPLPFDPSSYIGDIAIPAGTPSKKVYVAIGALHTFNDTGFASTNGRIFRSDDNGGTWIPLGGPALNLTIGSVNINHGSNPVNAIALDRANPQHVYIGCDVGVFKSVDEGATWTPYNENLPNVAVADLQFHDGARLLRAATIGRSVWERAVDAPAGGTGVDIFVRDNVTDIARGATAVNVANPLDLPNRLDWFTSLDLKVDTPFLGIGSFQTPASTVDYTPATAIDFIGYQKLDNNLARKAATSRVYAQVINRGPNPASNVQVRTFWAAKTGDNYPNLPTDFWTAFPSADPADTSVWKPVGPVRTIAAIPPGEPGVATWDWDVPRDSADTLGLLAVITVPEDPVNETGLNVQAVATSNKHVALREVGVNPSALAVVAVILLVAGVATLVVAEAV